LAEDVFDVVDEAGFNVAIEAGSEESMVVFYHFLIVGDEVIDFLVWYVHVS
jgi:hypothetical protein